MTPIEYTQFRETIRADRPELYRYLPDRFDLLGWQDFAGKLLEKLAGLESQIDELKDEIEGLEERLADC